MSSLRHIDGSFSIAATCNAAIIADEQNVLVAIYNATVGANWTHADKWNSGFDGCTWYGVSCNGDGHVVSLSLGGNHLGVRWLRSVRM